MRQTNKKPKLCFASQWDCPSVGILMETLFPVANKVQETGDIVISNAYVDLVPASAPSARTPSAVSSENPIQVTLPYVWVPAKVAVRKFRAIPESRLLKWRTLIQISLKLKEYFTMHEFLKRFFCRYSNIIQKTVFSGFQRTKSVAYREIRKQRCWRNNGWKGYISCTFDSSVPI